MNPVVVTILLVLGLFAFVLLIIFLAVFSRYFWLWVQSVMTGAKVTVIDLLGMLFRRVDARTIVRSKIMAVQAGIKDEDLTTKSLEAHY
ncbi:MAG: flotillin-like FloA family protein, partial [Pirellula sp.]